MEQIILILMLFIAINCAFKLSLWRWWQAGVYSLIMAVFTILAYPYAILQSKTQIVDYLQNNEALQNMAVIITLESALCFGFCVTYLRGLYGKKNPWWAKLLWWYPSLLLFPVVFYCLTEAIFTFVGIAFTTTTYMVATIVLVAIPALAKAVKYLVPEKDLRLEIHFLVSLFVCVLGLLTTVNGKTVYAAVDEPVNWNAVTLALSLFVILFIVGYVWSQIKYPLIQQWKMKKLKKSEKVKKVSQ